MCPHKEGLPPLRPPPLAPNYPQEKGRFFVRQQHPELVAQILGEVQHPYARRRGLLIARCALVRPRAADAVAALGQPRAHARQATPSAVWRARMAPATPDLPGWTVQRSGERGPQLARGLDDRAWVVQRGRPGPEEHPANVDVDGHVAPLPCVTSTSGQRKGASPPSRPSSARAVGTL